MALIPKSDGVPPLAASIVNPFTVTLLKVTLVPAVTRMSSLVASDPVSLSLTLPPSATED